MEGGKGEQESMFEGGRVCLRGKEELRAREHGTLKKK